MERSELRLKIKRENREIKYLRRIAVDDVRGVRKENRDRKCERKFEEIVEITGVFEEKTFLQWKSRAAAGRL